MRRADARSVGRFDADRSAHRLRAVELAVAAATVLGMAVRGHSDHATTVPDLALVWEIEGCPVDIDAATCGEVVPLDSGEFVFFGRYGIEGLGAMSWSMRVDPDPFVIANLTVVNNSAATQTFTLSIALPTQLAGPTLRGGSVAGSVTDLEGDTALLSAPPGKSVYVALVDGAPLPPGALLAAPYFVPVPPYETAAIGPAQFGGPIPSLAGPPVASSIGITLEFLLTAGDTAELTSIFVVEPAGPIEGGGAEDPDSRAERGAEEVEP